MDRRVITVIRDRSNTLGKRFSLNRDGTVRKSPGVQVAIGHAEVHLVPTHDALAELLRRVGDDPHAAIVPDGFAGIEPGEPFVIMSERELFTRLGKRKREDVLGVHDIELDGRRVRAVGRLKENIVPGAWRLLDRDVDGFTPERFANMSFGEWLDAVDLLLPGAGATSYVRTGSTSQRVLNDGEPVSSGNGHVWMMLENPDDGERAQQAIRVRAIENGLHWLKPRFSRTTGEQVSAGQATTVIDPSVWTPGRLVFVGKPVVSGGLDVAPMAAEVVESIEPTLWTCHAHMPLPDRVRELTRSAGCEMRVSGDGSGVKLEAYDLRLDMILETPEGDTLVSTAMEGRRALRCQTPFRESDSMAAKFNFSRDGRPFVHDVGTGVTHWLTDEDWKPILDAGVAEGFDIVDEAGDTPAPPPKPVATLDTLRATLKELSEAGEPAESLAGKLVRKIVKAKLSSVQEELALKDLKRATGISLGTLRETLRAAKMEGADDEEIGGNTHADYATRLLVSIAKDSGGNAPVGVEGNIYVVGADHVWRGKLASDYEVEVGREFSGLEHCHRRSDYTGIANHAYAIAAQGNSEFFADAPVGMASPDGMFYKLGEAGELKIEKLTAGHRQRFVVGAVPKPMATPLFHKFLAQTFASELPGDESEQVELLQEVMGAVMLGIMARYEKAVFLFGEGRAGKGTIQKIMDELVPKDWRTAVSPFKWDSEYYIASLAGKRLNLVGELPQSQPIPAAEFKTVTGRDQLTGRHPSGRPFLFRCEAAHIFNSNHLINTIDHSEAFFSRWIALEFRNSRATAGPSAIDVDLAAKIIKAELPGVLWWALQGARRLVARGHFAPGQSHVALMARWRRRTDSVLEFLHDADWCVLGTTPGRAVRRGDVFAAYNTWASSSGRKGLGKGKFYEMLDSPKCRALGVVVTRSAKFREVVHGLQIAENCGQIVGQVDVHESAENSAFGADDICDLV